jgi:hypothetical protein
VFANKIQYLQYIYFSNSAHVFFDLPHLVTASLPVGRFPVLAVSQTSQLGLASTRYLMRTLVSCCKVFDRLWSRLAPVDFVKVRQGNIIVLKLPLARILTRAPPLPLPLISKLGTTICHKLSCASPATCTAKLSSRQHPAGRQRPTAASFTESATPTPGYAASIS